METNRITKIYLIRHGVIENPNDISYGRMPIPLSEKGKKQIEELLQIFVTTRIKFDTIYTSPLVRAAESAQILASQLGNNGFEIREELNDVDVGELEGAPLQILRDAQYSEERLTEMGFKVESKPDVMARIVGLLEEVKKKHEGQTVAFVSHGDVIRLALWFCDYPEKRPPRILRDDDYLAPAEAVILRFRAEDYLGCGFVRKETSGQLERDSINRSESS